MKIFYRTIHDDFLLLGKICATSLPPLLLIAKEPDLGNTMVISAMLAAMILVSGIRWRFIFRDSFRYLCSWRYINVYFLLIQNSLKHTFYKNIN